MQPPAEICNPLRHNVLLYHFIVLEAREKPWKHYVSRLFLFVRVIVGKMQKVECELNEKIIVTGKGEQVRKLFLSLTGG